MTKFSSSDKKENSGIFKFFENVIEVIGWIKIMLSPLLLGILIGAIIYFPNRSAISLVIGLSIAALGLIVGILWANSAWKGKGTMFFLSRIMATPELDNQEENTESTRTNDSKSKVSDL